MSKERKYTTEELKEVEKALEVVTKFAEINRAYNMSGAREIAATAVDNIDPLVSDMLESGHPDNWCRWGARCSRVRNIKYS